MRGLVYALIAAVLVALIFLFFGPALLSMGGWTRTAVVQLPVVTAPPIPTTQVPVATVPVVPATPAPTDVHVVPPASAEEIASLVVQKMTPDVKEKITLEVGTQINAVVDPKLVPIKTTADNANTTATAAGTKADTALNTATTAKSTADEAKSTADRAVAAVDALKISAPAEPPPAPLEQTANGLICAKDRVVNAERNNCVPPLPVQTAGCDVRCQQQTIEAECRDWKFRFSGSLTEVSGEDVRGFMKESKCAEPFVIFATLPVPRSRPDPATPVHEKEPDVVVDDTPAPIVHTGYPPRAPVNECVPYVMVDSHGQQGALSEAGYKYVFVRYAEDARCLVGKRECGECQDWIRGYRGAVLGPAAEVRGPRSLAFRVYPDANGVIMMPRYLHGPVASCDRVTTNREVGEYGSWGLMPL